MDGSSPPSFCHGLCSVPFRAYLPSPIFLPKIVFLEDRRGKHGLRHEQQRLATTATTRTRLELGLGWPTPTDRGTGITPNGAEASFRAYGSDSARCAASTARLGVLVAPSTHAVNAETECIRLTYIGHFAGSAVCGDGFNEWVVADRKFQSGRRSVLAMYCFLHVFGSLLAYRRRRGDEAGGRRDAACHG